MTRNMTRTTTTPNTRTLDALARRAPATDDLLQLADWLATNGAAHLSAIERIELAERLITRRRFLIGAGALGLGVITGCGADEQATAPTATRMITDDLGREVEIPESPSRIAILNVTVEGDPLIALGVKPIAAPEPIRGRVADYAHIPEGMLDDAAPIGEPGSINLEALAAANPDLILTSTFNAENVGVELLEQITSLVAIDFFGGERSLWERIEFIAEVAGVPEAVDEIRTEYERAASAANTVTNGESVAFIRPFPRDGRLITYHEDSMLGPLFADAGLTLAPPPAGIETDEMVSGQVPDLSLELLPELEGDVMLVWLLDVSEEQFREEYLSTPVWQNNPMIADGQFYLVTGEEMKISRSPLAAQRTFETLERIFNE